MGVGRMSKCPCGDEGKVYKVCICEECKKNQENVGFKFEENE